MDDVDEPGIIDDARHVMGCQMTQVTRVQIAFDELASTIHQSLRVGGERGGLPRGDVREG